MLVRLAGHPAVEGSPKVWMSGDVLPHRRTVHALERGLAGHDARAQPAPDLPHFRRADEQRPVADGIWSVAPERHAERSDRESSIDLLAKDAGTREHAEQPV